MHYNVIPKEEFVHNNMTPFTSRRETFINLDSNTRKYEQLTGNNSTWKYKKMGFRTLLVWFYVM